MYNFFIGIDPGVSGGIAVIDIDGNALASCKYKSLVNFLNIIREYANKKTYVVIERVHSSPQMGVVSAFTFGESYGYSQGFLQALNLKAQIIRPQDWQGYLKCLTKGDKSITKKKAKRLFPEYNVTNYNADALLLAEYGRRTNS